MPPKHATVAHVAALDDFPRCKMAARETADATALLTGHAASAAHVSVSARGHCSRTCVYGLCLCVPARGIGDGAAPSAAV